MLLGALNPELQSTGQDLRRHLEKRARSQPFLRFPKAEELKKAAAAPLKQPLTEGEDDVRGSMEVIRDSGRIFPKFPRDLLDLLGWHLKETQKQPQPSRGL